MFYGEVPFNGDNLKELYSNIKSAKITQNSSSSPALRDLLNLIFVKDYSKRITVEKCLEHSWFKIGNKTPIDTGILKKNIIEEINTDTNFIKNEENNSNSSELRVNKDKSSMKEKTSEENFRSSEDKNSDESKHSKPVELKAKRKMPPRTLILGGGRGRKCKNNNKSKISPLIKYSILFIKYYIRIYFQKDKEMNKLNNIYLKYKIEKNINIFVNYINCKRIISFDSFYYNQNDSLNKNLSKNIKEQINNKEELFKILIQNKKNMIESNLKTSYGKLKKSSVDEIKNIFKESNSFNLYEIKKYKQYFNEIEFEMEKNKYKEIYLFMDFYKLLINSINKLYAQYLNNNISTNVDSSNTFNTMFGFGNKSKESIKNEFSKVNSDNIIISDQSNNNIMSIDIIKEEQEKNKDTINDNDNNNKNCEVNNTSNVNKENKDNENITDKNELKGKSVNEISKLNNNEVSESVNNGKNENENINKLDKLDKSNNKSDNCDINNYSCNNVCEDNNNNSDEDEYEKRKNDVNRFDPEKFLINIGFS
jgi:hypothetical protein